MSGDIALSFRLLRRSPAFTAAAVLTMGLGIGATTAIVSVLDATMLRVVPFPDADRIVYLSGITAPPASSRIEYFGQAQTLQDIAEFDVGRATFGGADATSVITVARVSPSMFRLASQTPAAGAFFVSGTPGPPAVLSEALARATFGSPAGALGRTVLLADVSHLVVGVTQEGFDFPWATDAWVNLPPDARDGAPLVQLASSEGAPLGLDRGTIARLREGVSREHALAEIRLLQQQAEDAVQGTNPDLRLGRSVVSLTLLQDRIVRDHKLLLTILAAAALVVLVIACANLANLLLVRSVSRRDELAVRASLGATRSRMLRQLLAEALVLACLSVGAGVLIAVPILEIIKRLGPPEAAGLANASINAPVLGFTVAAALAVTVLTALFPGYRAVGTLAVRPGTRQPTLPHRRLQQLAIVMQIALSLGLVTGAVLLSKSLTQLLHVDPGFSPRGVNLLEVLLPHSWSPEGRQARMTAILERLSGVRDVTATAWVDHAPLRSMGGYSWVDPGDPADPRGGLFKVSAVTPAYFAVLRIPVLDGRAFVEADITAQRHIAVVNEELAQRFWPGQHAIGRSVDINTERHEVVGVVPRVTHQSLAEPPLPQLYVPGPRSTGRIGTLLVRSGADGAPLAGVLRAAMQDIAPSAAIVSLRPLTDLVQGSAREQRFRTYLIAAFAVLALGLAASGLYGTVAWIVHRRSHEFGVRLALGATPADLVVLLSKQSALTIGTGLALGLVGSAASAAALRGLLFGVDPQDPGAFAWAAGTLVVTAAAATYVPARRAARVDPVQSLKAE